MGIDLDHCKSKAPQSHTLHWLYSSTAVYWFPTYYSGQTQIPFPLICSLILNLQNGMDRKNEQDIPSQLARHLLLDGEVVIYFITYRILPKQWEPSKSNALSCFQLTYLIHFYPVLPYLLLYQHLYTPVQKGKSLLNGLMLHKHESVITNAGGSTGLPWCFERLAAECSNLHGCFWNILHAG